MEIALRLAQRAGQQGEVPVGAVVVYQGKVVGRGENQVEGRRDSSCHAEIMALRQAARRLGRWRLTGCTLYATLEPCAMCAGAAVLARIDRLVYAARDPKAGACGSVLQVVANRRLNHRIAIAGGVRDAEAARLIKDFFKARRTEYQARTAEGHGPTLFLPKA